MTKKKALQLAVNAMQKERRKFAVGYNAYLEGYRAPFAERNYKQYNELSEAILIIKEDQLGGK